MTDQKSYGKQFSDVLVNLKGVHSSGTATRPSFMSLDFIESKNVLDKGMREAILKLERRSEETRRRFETDYGYESWFPEWDTRPESTQAETDDVEDAALWRDAGVSDFGS